jgi:large subunit ribosomal protein L1
MIKLPKRKQAWAKLREHNKNYALLDALKIVKQAATAKFDEAVDVAINLGIDANKSDQTVRGSVVLPAGTGKKVRVAVFAQGDKAQAAKDAGADIVGMDDLAEQVKAGKIDFDVVIASPDTMRVVGQLGQILGPRGLMPNPKVGTVTPDVAGAVRNARASFAPEQLRDNLVALVDAVNKSKPSSIKGIYLRKVSVSSTMGPGVRVDVASFGSGAAQHR